MEKDWGGEQVNENDKITAKNIAKEIVEETKNIDSIRWEKLKQNSYSVAVIGIVILFASGTILFSLNLLDEKIISLENNQKDLLTKIINVEMGLTDKLHDLEISYIEGAFKINQILTLMENNDEK